MIEYGTGEKATHSVVRTSELLDLPASGRVEDQAALYESTFHGESAITAALIALREGRSRKSTSQPATGNLRSTSRVPVNPGSGSGVPASPQRGPRSQHST